MRRIGTLDSALISAKEEKLVLHDGTAEGSPKLISLQRVARWCKEVSRIKDSIPQKFECIAVEDVRTGLGDDIHVGRCVHAVLRRQSTGFDFEFL